MCTAATYQTRDFYFGRTLDYEFSYGEEIVVMPRRFPLNFRHMGNCSQHYALVGMAHVAEGTPLFYDAINEKGLGMAGLNFVGNADYKSPVPGKDNVASFEFIPWILGQCASLEEAKQLLSRMNLVSTPFAPSLPASQLHWLIADSTGAITVECVKEGLKVYDNPAGVMTNNPPFPEAARKSFLRQSAPAMLQPGHGCAGSARRPELSVPICAGGICAGKFRLRHRRGGKRQPVLPHSRFR